MHFMSTNGSHAAKSFAWSSSVSWALHRARAHRRPPPIWPVSERASHKPAATGTPPWPASVSSPATPPDYNAPSTVTSNDTPTSPLNDGWRTALVGERPDDVAGAAVRSTP
jgi:hypothetical protein